MKSPAALFAILGLVLMSTVPDARAQDQNPAPAATEQTAVGTQATAEVVSPAPATAKAPEAATPTVTTAANSASTTPAETVAPVAEKPAAVAAPATEKTAAGDNVKAVPENQKPETAAPVAEKPAAIAAPATEKTAAGDSVKAVPETQKPETGVEASAKPAAEKTVAANAPDFELERSSADARPAAKGEAGAQPKTSFWSRLFGSKKADTNAAVSAKGESSQAASGVTGKADTVVAPPVAVSPEKAAATNAGSEVGAKLMVPEEVMAAQEEVRRQAKEVEALKYLDSAYQAMARNDFDVALKSFNQAMNVMPVRPHTVETRQKAMQSQAECEYRIALNYYSSGKYQEAKDAIRRALGYNSAHQKAVRLSEQIKKDEVQRVERAAEPVPPRKSAEHLDRVKQIRTSIDLGRQYYVLGEYEKARREFQNVLVLDEKNEEAAAWMDKLYVKMYDVETDQMNRQQASMVAQVRDTWTPPVKREITGPDLKIKDAEITDSGKRKLLAKLNGITIPQLEFRTANIADVIKYLDQASIACDKDSAPGDKGVNFILQLKRPGVSEEAAAPAPAEGELTVEGAAPVGPSNLPTVTLSLRNIVLMDAIKYITEVTGLKYRIEENVVVITPSDVVYGELVTKTYKVQPSIAETIMGAAGSAGGGTSDKLELGSTAPAVEKGDVKKFFVDAGVPFPEGTSIVYKPSLNLLIAKNTLDNLESFERILASLNVVPVQVEIEARFVEVAQQDLEELGVEWLLNDNWEIAENIVAGQPLNSAERIQVDKSTVSKGLRNLASGASGITTTQGGTLGNILSFSSVLTNPEVTMVLHALEQKSGANLLSAPKVTTKSGANAEIKVVEEYIYPTDFTLVTPAASGSTQGSQTPMSFVQPGGFQTRDTGVILNVTPTVGPDGFSIDLVMLPQVCELASWLDYGTQYPNPSGDGTYELKMPQPIFKSRNITTSITIWDGQTVVMGGLISERQTTTLDKIPFLGDIPLIGYLFQSKTSNSQKFNLLIFVTANLVDPAGNKINKELIATSAGTSGTTTAAPTATP